MLFAASDTIIMWVITAVLGFLNTVFAGWMLYLNAKLAAEKERNRYLDSSRLSWKELAKEGRQTTQGMANAVLEKEGLPPVVQVAPVVSESHSPSTEKQRDEAELATEKAAIVAIRLAVGQQPRPEPERAGDQKPATAGDVRTAVKDALTEKVDAVKKDVKVIRSDVAEVKEEILGDKP